MQEEALAVTGKPGPSDAAQTLLTRVPGRIQWVVVKLGGAGSQLHAHFQSISQPAFKVRCCLNPSPQYCLCVAYWTCEPACQMSALLLPAILLDIGNLGAGLLLTCLLICCSSENMLDIFRQQEPTQQPSLRCSRDMITAAGSQLFFV